MSRLGKLLPAHRPCPTGWAATFAVAIGLVSLLGCDPPLPPAADTEGVGLFDHPQPLRFIGDLLVVGNSGYRPGADWAAGSLSVVDPSSGALINRIPTSQPNPQRLVVHGDALYVVATGVMDLTDFDRPTTATPGAIDVLPLATLRTAEGPARSIPVERVEGALVTAAAPLDLAFAGDLGVITLGVANAVRLLDAQAGTLGPPLWLDTPRVGLGSVQAWGERFVVVDFNADALYVVDADGVWPCAVALAPGPDVEGPNTLAVVGDVAYVTLSFSGRLQRIDLAPLRRDRCDAPVETIVAPVGDVPNDLHVRGDAAWVIDSGRNTLVAYDLATGAARTRYVLPPGANPWHAAWRADGRHVAVTEWGADAISVFDTLTGARRRFGGAPVDAPPPPPEAPVEAQVAGAVVEAPDSPAVPGFGDPAAATNGVRGGGNTGGTDVYSLGPDDALVLRWPGQRLLDGPGPDLAVFENPFPVARGSEVFMDPIVVELSRDGETWVAFPHDYRAADETIYRAEPSLWVGFAGRTPVFLHAEDYPVDPFDPTAGGDTFDLADLPAGGEADALRAEGAVFVRLSAATAWINPDTGAPFVADPISNGPDIDGIAARWLVAE